MAAKRKKSPAKPVATNSRIHAGSSAVARAKLGGTPAAFASSVERLLSITADWELLEGLGTDSRIWRLDMPYTIVDGSIVAEGAVVVGTGKHDYGALIVLGDVCCRNFVVSSGFSFACTGSLRATEVISATAGDSVSYVAGEADAALVDSGAGAWLTLFDPARLVANAITHYVMVHNKPIHPHERVDLRDIVVDRAIEWEEWLSLAPEDRVGETPVDYIRMHSDARRMLANGESILRVPRPALPSIE